MNYRKAFISTCHYGWHKGFYNDGDYSSALGHIKYTDFFDDPYTEEFPYDSAEVLLCGSCNIFAFCLQKWNMIDVVEPEEIEDHNVRIFVLPHSEKYKWQLIKKFNVKNLENV